MDFNKLFKLYCKAIHSRRSGVPRIKISRIRGVVNLAQRDGTSALRRQLRAMVVKAQLVTATSSNGPQAMVIGRIVLVQGLTSIMGTDVRATDEAHPQLQAEVFRTAQAMGEDGATARTRRGKVGLQTLVTGIMTSVPGRGTADHNAMDLPRTSGSIVTVEVEDEDMTTGDVGTNSKDSTNLKVRTNSKVGTNLRAKGKVITHLQVNIRTKVSTSKVLNRDRHHRTRNKIKEVGIKDKATIKVKVALTNREWK